MGSDEPQITRERLNSSKVGKIEFTRSAWLSMESDVLTADVCNRLKICPLTQFCPNEFF